MCVRACLRSACVRIEDELPAIVSTTGTAALPFVLLAAAAAAAAAGSADKCFEFVTFIMLNDSHIDNVKHIYDNYNSNNGRKSNRTNLHAYSVIQ